MQSKCPGSGLNRLNFYLSHPKDWKHHVCLLAAVFIMSRLEKKSVKAPTERRHKTPVPLLRPSGRSPWLMPADGEVAEGPSQWYSVHRDALLAWHRKQLCRNKCGDPSGWSSSCSHTRSGGRTGNSLVIKKDFWGVIHCTVAFAVRLPAPKLPRKSFPGLLGFSQIKSI